MIALAVPLDRYPLLRDGVDDEWVRHGTVTSARMKRAKSSSESARQSRRLSAQ